MSINLILTIIKSSYFNDHFRNEKTEPREIKKLTLGLRARNWQEVGFKSKDFLFVLMISQLICFPLCIIIPLPYLIEFY